MRMKKLVKSIVRLFVGLLVLALLSVIAVGLLADNAAKVAVESAGSKALNVPVNVAGADLSLLGGTLGLQEVTVANPPGYRQETLLELERGDIRVDTRSLLSDTIRIKDIKLDGMAVAIEQKGLQNNLREVIRSLQRDQDPSGKKVQVDSLEITNITVTVKLLPIPGQADTLRFELAPIKVANLGQSQPMDLATLVTTILLVVAEEITEEGGGTLPSDPGAPGLMDLSGVLNKALDLGRILFGNGNPGAPGRTP